MNEQSDPLARTPFLGKTEAVRVTRDVTYAHAGIDYSPETGARQHRALKLDVYEPERPSPSPRPALILAFGGAFHRGSKETDEFDDEEGSFSTPVSEYCRLFAERGYVCFCIDYRLTQERPDPGVTPVLDPAEPMNKDRVNVVREWLGFPPASDEELRWGIEAATDDMAQAVYWVRSRSRLHNVDIGRIAVGGFSAGAMIALNAALLERAPVGAVVSISGRVSPGALEMALGGAPPILMLIGERDLPAILDGSERTQAALSRADPRHRVLRLPGATHFYPKTTRTAEGGDVERAIATFLYDALRLGPHGAAD